MINRLLYKILLTSAFFLMLTTVTYSQNTVGLLTYDFEKTYEGYSLIAPDLQPNVFLLNNCGEIIHEWTDTLPFVIGSACLLPDGRVLKAKQHLSHQGDSIWSGGAGEIAELRSWDNELLWRFELNTDTKRLHHDIKPMPNGNVLMIAWEKKTAAEAIAAGRNPGLISEGKLWPDYIIEVNPETDEIVWEWHAWDHLVQDFDSEKENFGVVADHPELIDLNYDTRGGKADWMHSNAIDYNEMLDQVMLGVPAFNEIWIIDHGTTTAEAAGHSGGALGHGGDLLYRVGNPQAYQKGDSTDQILFFQHNAHWVNELIPFGGPHFGEIVCFNNRVGPDYSSVEIFESSWNMYLGDYEQFDGRFPPFEFENSIVHPDTQKMYSNILSSAQVLPNGNIFIVVGRQEYLFELTAEGDVVWEYKIPMRNGMPVSQGDDLFINDNFIFKAFKYPVNYPAFDGRDLTPIGYIEQNPDEEYCDFLIATDYPEVPDVRLFPTVATNSVFLNWGNQRAIDVKIYDVLGNLRLQSMGFGGDATLDIHTLTSGIYFVVINDIKGMRMIVR